jgi:cyanophycinase
VARSPEIVAALGAVFLLSIAVDAGTDQLTGVWEGTVQRGERRQPIAFVFRPEGASFAGRFYLDGAESGVVEDVRLDGNAIHFKSIGISFDGSLDGAELRLTATVQHGNSFPFAITRTSPDPARLPSSVRPDAAARAAEPKAPEPAPDAIYLAHAVPAGEAPSLHPSLRKRTLLLVGGGAGQDDINARFRELAGGPSARIVYIPTASAVAGVPVEKRAENSARILGVPKVALLHTLSRREADTEAFVRPLRDATAAWIDGGSENVLVDTYMGTRTERELIALLERGGVVGGTSAGALIWGSKLVVARKTGDTKPWDRPQVGDLVFGDIHDASIGLLRDVMIIPHYTEFHMEKVLAALVTANPGLLGLGIDEATALEVHGDGFRVLGRGSVTVIESPKRAKDPLVLRSGSRYGIGKREARLTRS